MLILAGSGPLRAEDYRIAPGDEIRVVAADPSQISGTYLVGPDGSVVIPLVERLAVAGLTVAASTAALKARLSQTIVQPSAGIEIARYRPVYVLGDVANPGTYPYQPGLSLIGAVAFASGFRGRSDYFQLNVTAIRTAESLAQARQQLLEAIVARARIEAEIAEQPRFAVPRAALANLDLKRLDEIVTREQRSLDVRDDAVVQQVRLIEKEIALKTEEISALDNRIKGQGRQADLLRNEMKEAQDMLARGLAPGNRLSGLSREESRMQGEALQTAILQNQARQSRNQAELQISTLRRDRKLQLLNELQEVSSRIDRLSRQVQADEAVLQEANSGLASGSRRRFVTTFKIRRGGVTLPDTIDEYQAAEPGDIVTVERTLMQIVAEP